MLRLFFYPWGVGLHKRGEIHWRALLHKGGFYWRRNGAFWKLKAPWEWALFSEREGYVKTVWRCLGWRLLRDDTRPIEDVEAKD